jgi:hypothetical protein
VGQYALQILRYYGYTKLLTTASKTHHEMLRSLGAHEVFDYRDLEISSKILSAANHDILFVLDCIGSKDGSVVPISKIVKKGAKVAVLLPVVVKDASETEAPEYELDAEKSADWAEGVIVRGVRTHFYLNVSMLPEKIEDDILMCRRTNFSSRTSNQRSCQRCCPRVS